MSGEFVGHVPSNPTAEWGLVLAKAAASLIHFAGGPAAEVLGAIIQPQLEKRKTEWLEGIARGLHEVQQQIAAVTPERLSQDPTFTSAFLHASQIAMRTHQRAKLRALQNAVLNVAVGATPDDDLQLVLLNLIDQLAPWHLRLLAYLDEPMDWMERHGVATPPNPSLDGVTLVNYAFPELDVRNSFTMVYLDELFAQRLLRHDWNETTNYRARGTRGALRTSELGKRLLAFITAPISEANSQTGGE